MGLHLEKMKTLKIFAKSEFYHPGTVNRSRNRIMEHISSNLRLRH